METTSSFATDWEEISRLMGASLPRKECGLKKEKQLRLVKEWISTMGKQKKSLN
jgi:hypothetical protein